MPRFFVWSADAKRVGVPTTHPGTSVALSLSLSISLDNDRTKRSSGVARHPLAHFPRRPHRRLLVSLINCLRMYSSYWKPNDGRESTVRTDHEALHRDEATHKAMQSDETELRPLDLETIMSSKAAVKFWYLHRPKTMAYVHKNATKIQSLGRAFAVRRLREQHGAEYMAELARQDQVRRDADALKELSDEERAYKETTDAAYDARVDESRRQRREQMEKEQRAEEEVRMKQAEEAAERRRLEEERKAAALAEEERLAAEETARLEALRVREQEARQAAEALEAVRLAEEEAERVEQERVAAEEADRVRAEAAARAAEEARVLEEERVRELEEERRRVEEQERLAEEQRMRRREEEIAAVAAQAREEEERQEREAAEARARKEERRVQKEREQRKRRLAEEALTVKRAQEEAERLRQKRIVQEQNERYEQSLSKDVPVLVRHRDAGRVMSYDKARETYTVKMDSSIGGMQITVPSRDVNLDDERILSPRTKVDTPFGTGEVVGLDPHVGCYAINTEVNATEGDQFLAFVQIKDVAVYVEEEEERAIVEDASLPSTLLLVAVRWQLWCVLHAN